MSDWLNLPTICPQHGIDKLRAKVDFTRYEATTECPLWMRHLAAQAKSDLGVLGLLGPSGLSVAAPDGGRIRPVLDQACLYLAGLTDSLRGSGKRMAIGVPTAGRHLPLLLAAAAVLANTFDRALGRRCGGVLVISPDLELRSRYCDLFVQKEAIDRAHPGSRLRPTGEQVMLQPKAKVTDEGVCFFLPGLALPSKVRIWPDLVLLDLRFGRWARRTADLCRWTTTLWSTAGIVALYTVGDRDTLGMLIAGGFLDFPLDHQAVGTCIYKSAGRVQQTPEFVVDWQLGEAAGYLTRKHEVHLVTAQKLEELLQQIATLLDQHAQKESPDLNRARWLFATLSQLPVPIAWYDGAAANRGRFTLARLVEGLGAESKSADGIGAVIQSLKLLFSAVLIEISKGNPRAAALKDLLCRLAHAGPEVTVQVLVRDRISAHALDTWLAVEVCAGEEWLSRVRIHACPTYGSSSETHADVTIVNGPFPRRYRWLAGADLGGSVHFLTYSYETEVVESQLQSFYAGSACDERRRNREHAISRALSCRIEHDPHPEYSLPSLNIRMPAKQAVKSKGSPQVTFRGSLSDLGRLWENSRKTYESDHSRDEPAWLNELPEDDSQTEATLVAEDLPVSAKDCVHLNLRSRAEGRGSLIIRKDTVIDCLRLSIDEDLRRLPAGDVRVGDVILLVGEQRRAGLFETIVDLAECQPTMEYLAAFRRRWRIAVQAMAANYTLGRGVDYSRLLRDLEREGATIESEAAVRLWVQDQIIGPQTIESIRAVGRVANSPAVSDQARDFQQAFRKMRGLRRGIGLRLSNVIRNSFRHLAVGDTPVHGETLDDRLGLPVDELLEAIDIAEVISIATPESSLPISGVGRFIRGT